MLPMYLRFLRARPKQLQLCWCELATLVLECSQEYNLTLSPGNENHVPIRDPHQARCREALAMLPPLGAPAWKMRQQQSAENAQSVPGEGIVPSPSAVPLHIICASTHSLRCSQALMLLLITIGSQAAMKTASPIEAETAPRHPYVKYIGSPLLFASSRSSHPFY